MGIFWWQEVWAPYSSNTWNLNDYHSWDDDVIVIGTGFMVKSCNVQFKKQTSNNCKALYRGLL